VQGIKNPSVNVNRLNIVTKLAQLVSQKQEIINTRKRLGGEVEKFEGLRDTTLYGRGQRR